MLDCHHLAAIRRWHKRATVTAVKLGKLAGFTKRTPTTITLVAVTLTPPIHIRELFAS